MEESENQASELTGAVTELQKLLKDAAKGRHFFHTSKMLLSYIASDKIFSTKRYEYFSYFCIKAYGYSLEALQ